MGKLTPVNDFRRVFGLALERGLALKISRLTATAAVTAFFGFPLYLISLNNGADPGHTNGPFPGESSCGRSDCHNVALNTGPGRIFMTAGGVPIEQYSYRPGETVRMEVRVEDPSPTQGLWGFQLTVRNDADRCKSEGRMVAVNADVRVQTSTFPVGPCAGPEYATHEFKRIQGGGYTFLLDWTAPATNVGPVIFAAAGNAANGNNEKTGDRIYTTSATVQPAGAPPPTPSINQGGIVLAPASSGAPITSIAAPLALLSIFGQEFAPAGTAAGPVLDQAGRVSTQLAGVCVEIGGQRSPMLFVGAGQVNVQASGQVVPGSHSVNVIRNCGVAGEVRSEPQTVNIAAMAPGFFVFPQFGGQNGANPIAALHGGGPNVVAPANLFQNNAQQTFSPAAPGEFISLFGTGFGAVDNNSVVAGEIPNRTVNVTGDVRVSIGGIELPPYNRQTPGDIFYAGVAPCCAGLYQLVVKVPSNLTAGNHGVTVTIDGVSSPPGPFIPVQ